MSRRSTLLEPTTAPLLLELVKNIVFGSPALSVVRKLNEDVRRNEFPRPFDRSGRFGWFGKIDSNLSAQAVAGIAGAESVFQRMELLRAGQSRDQQRQETSAPDAHDLLADPRDGLRGPLRAPFTAAVAGGLSGAVRSLYFHGVRARCRARLPARMGPRHLQFRR